MIVNVEYVECDRGWKKARGIENFREGKRKDRECSSCPARLKGPTVVMSGKVGDSTTGIIQIELVICLLGKRALKKGTKILGPAIHQSKQWTPFLVSISDTICDSALTLADI